MAAGEHLRLVSLTKGFVYTIVEVLMAAKYVPIWKKCINILIRYMISISWGHLAYRFIRKNTLIYRDVLRAAIGSLPPTQGVGGQRRC